MNTSELEARLAGLLAKATAEWSIVEYGDGDSLVIHSDDENRVCFMATHGGSRTAWERIQAHADLITEGKNALPALLHSLSTLRQRIEALEAALRPFAELADFYENCEQHPYGCPDTALCGELPDLTVGSFRAARQALGEG